MVEGQGLSLVWHEPSLAITQKPLLLPTSGPITDASLALRMPTAVLSCDSGCRNTSEL